MKTSMKRLKHDVKNTGVIREEGLSLPVPVFSEKFTKTFTKSLDQHREKRESGFDGVEG